MTLKIRFAVWYGEKPLAMDEVLAKYPTKDFEKEEEPTRKKIDTSLPASVNAPLFPESRNHSWWILLAETKGVVTCATLKETALKPDENFAVLETSFKLRWPKVGKTNFTLHVQSDSYIDVGFSETVVVSLSHFPPLSADSIYLFTFLPLLISHFSHFLIFIQQSSSTNNHAKNSQSWKRRAKRRSRKTPAPSAPCWERKKRPRLTLIQTLDPTRKRRINPQTNHSTSCEFITLNRRKKTSFFFF